MNIELIGLVASGVVIAISIIVLAFQVRQLKRTVSGIQAQKPSIPSPAMIRDWQEKRAGLPEGSPKHTAYTNRLREIGAL